MSKCYDCESRATDQYIEDGSWLPMCGLCLAVRERKRREFQAELAARKKQPYVPSAPADSIPLDKLDGHQDVPRDFVKTDLGHTYHGHDGHDYIVTGWRQNDGPYLSPSIDPALKQTGPERTVSYGALGRTFHHRSRSCPKCMEQRS